MIIMDKWKGISIVLMSIIIIISLFSFIEISILHQWNDDFIVDYNDGMCSSYCDGAGYERYWYEEDIEKIEHCHCAYLENNEWKYVEEFTFGGD